MEAQPLLRVRNISKHFGATRALSGANMDVMPGEIHSLLGRNGAGKSTLVNIIAGIYPPTDGEVTFEGQDIRHLNIFQRQELGIRLVPQHENSFPDLTVGENIFVGVLPKKGGLVDWATIHARAAEELRDYGLVDVRPTDLVKDLSSIDARKLNIIRAMHSGAKLIILDEPTTALTTRERNELFEFVNALKAKGTAFIFISHYLGEVMQLSDGISVLRDGLMFGVDEEQEVNEEYLGALVAGETVELTRRSPLTTEERQILFRIDDLHTHDLHGVTGEIRKGEILGVVGFPGSGAREFCRALFGINPILSGAVWDGDKPLDLSSPDAAIKQGIAYISFDRHREGVIPVFSVNENMGISVLKGKLRRALGFIDLAQQRRLSEQYRDELKVKCASIDAPIGSLSGGNQQKVLVGRLLNTDPRLLILDEPTIGIDIKSREEIIAKVLELSLKGMSTIYLTNDYEELLRVADRLVFFDQGVVTRVLENDNVTIDELTDIRDGVKEAG